MSNFKEVAINELQNFPKNQSFHMKPADEIVTIESVHPKGTERHVKVKTSYGTTWILADNPYLFPKDPGAVANIIGLKGQKFYKA